MKHLILSFIAIAPFSCAKQNPNQITEEYKAKEITDSIPRRVASQGRLQSSRSQEVNGRLTTVSNVELKREGARFIVNDDAWSRDWENTSLNEKVVYWSTERYNSVRNFSIQNQDLSEMAGFDFSPLITYMNKALPWDAKTFVQQHIHVPAIDEERTTWTEGNKTYYFLPKSFERKEGSHLPQFDLTFPTYELPKGKISIYNFRKFGQNDQKVLNQGHTFILNNSLPSQYLAMYDGDQWLYEAGCPHAYSKPMEEVVRWLDNVDENVLLNSFKKHFYNRYKDIGYVAMNWEAIGWARSESFWKLQRCFDYWYSQKPNAKLSIWGNGGFFLNRAQIEGNNYEYLLSKAWNEPVNWKLYTQGANIDQPLSRDDFYAKNADYLFVGGYLNFPTNYGYIQHFLIQYQMNKKYFPEKKSILSWWHHQEYVGAGFPKAKYYFEDAQGNTRYVMAKPMVFPDAMHNASVWSHAFCDGADLWSEGYSRMDNPRYLGSDSQVYDTKGQIVKTQHYPNENAFHAIQNYQNIDRWEGGKWAISQSKDIIDAKTDWEFANVKKGRQLFEDVIPPTSLYSKTPLVATKLSENKKEVLILAYDAWNNPLEQEVLSVKVANKWYDVKLFGRYTSVIRIML